MHRRIDTALRRIRQDLSNLLDRSTVQPICRQVGPVWRAGVFCPYATLHWFLLQVLSGNIAHEHIATLAKKAFMTRPIARRERGFLWPSTKRRPVRLLPRGNQGHHSQRIEIDRGNPGGRRGQGIRLRQQCLGDQKSRQNLQRAYFGGIVSAQVEGEAIQSTFHHPFWIVRGKELETRRLLDHLPPVPEGCQTEGRWVDACDIRVGDEVLLADGRIVPIQGITYSPFEGDVYNFQVEDLHSYAVSNLGGLVHNSYGDSLAGALGNAVNNARERINRSVNGLTYVGRTPGKSSATGRKQVARLRAKETVKDNGILEAVFKSGDRKQHPIALADMAHKMDAVNRQTKYDRQFGVRSPEVRKWMLDSKKLLPGANFY